MATSAVVVNMLSVSGVRFINNTNPLSQYTVNQNSANSITTKVQESSDIEQQFSEVGQKNFGQFNSMYSYLVKHNILSLINGISVSSNNVNLEQEKLDSTDLINRSQFLVDLYKSVYGVIPSRPLVFNVLPTREINGKEEIVNEVKDYQPKDFKFKNGYTYKFDNDKDVYISPDVTELYLTELENLGIINSSELNSNFKQFKQSDNPFYVSQTNYKETPLGNSWKIVNCFNAEKVKMNYFNNPNITVLQGLDYVKELLTKDGIKVSQDKLNGANYNYGIYYQTLNPQEQDTLNYLIALGIIQINSKQDFSNLFGEMSIGSMSEILYRVSNSSDRYKNNLTIPKTSSTLANEGYKKSQLRIATVSNINGSAKTISVQEINNNTILADRTTTQDSKKNSPVVEDNKTNNLTVPEHIIKINAQVPVEQPENVKTEVPDKSTETVQVPAPTNVKSTGLISDLKNSIKEIGQGELDQANGTNKVAPHKLGAQTNGNPSPSNIPSGTINPGDKTTQNKQYLITKVFPDMSAYDYNGEPLTSLKGGSNSGMSIKTQKNGNTTSAEIVFRVNAQNPATAIAIVDGELTQTLSGVQQFKNLSTITKVTQGNVSTTYISEAALNDAFSMIQVVGARVLRNKETGTMAYISDKCNLALVGNSIYKDGQYMMIDDNGELYYNINVIMGLLRNSELTNLNSFGILQISNLPNEQLIPVYSSPSHGTGVNLQNCYVISENQVKGMSGNDVFYNVNQLTKGVSTVERTYQVKGKDGKEVPCTVVINWHYAMPTNYKGNTTTESLSKIPNGNFSVKDAANFLYTKPTNETLLNWWNSNITLDNALADFIYSMPNTQIIKSGFLEPSVTVLCQSNDVSKSDVLNSIFDGKLTFPAGYVSSSISGFKQNASNEGQDWLGLFNQRTGTASFRHFGILFGTKDGNLIKYNNDYVSDEAGNIFRLAGSDPRVEYNGKVLLVNSRTSPLGGTLKQNSIYTFEGKQYEFMGYTKDGLYATLVGIKPVTGPIVKKPDNVMTITNSSMDTNYLMDYMQEIVDPLTPGTYMQPEPSNMTLVPSGKYMKSGNYVIQGNAYNWNGSTKSQINSTDVNNNKLTGSAFPTIYLNRTDYSSIPIKGGNEIIFRPVNPAVVQGNIFYSGINNSMINSILAGCEGQKNISQMPQGATVYIGDLTFKVEGNKLVSTPISGEFAGNFAKALASPNNQQDQKQLQSVVGNLLNGLTMYYGQRPVSFASYINQIGVGQALPNVSTTGELIQSGDMYYLYPDTPYQRGTIPKSVSLSIEPNNYVKFLCIDNKTKSYTLVTNTDVFCSGYLDNTSMFSNSLDLDLDDDIFARMQKPTFELFPHADLTRSYEEESFNQKVKQDILWFLVGLIVFIASYLVVMSWMMFAFQRIPLATNLIMALIYPGGSSARSGFDPFAFMTFGFLNFETPLTLSRIFISSLMLSIVIYIVSNVL